MPICLKNHLKVPIHSNNHKYNHFQDKRELELKLLKTEQEMKTMQEMQEAEKKAGNAKHGKPDSSNDRRK